MSRYRLDVRTPDGVMDCYVSIRRIGSPEDNPVLDRRLSSTCRVRLRPNIARWRTARFEWYGLWAHLYYRTVAFAPFDPNLYGPRGPNVTFKGKIASIDGRMVRTIRRRLGPPTIRPCARGR